MGVYQSLSLQTVHRGTHVSRPEKLTLATAPFANRFGYLIHIKGCFPNRFGDPMNCRQKLHPVGRLKPIDKALNMNQTGLRFIVAVEELVRSILGTRQ